jgi:Family of unknown function (DUF5670)
MLYTIISLLVLCWFVGFLLNYGGSAIHLLLLVAGAVFIYDLITGRRSA